MLGLKLKTDPRWANIAEGNLAEILSDHAWCEQKAATNAINLIINNSEKEDLVTEMTKIAIEEMDHFRMVHDIIKERNYEFTRERKDDYVGQLRLRLIFWGLSKKFLHSKEEEFSIHHTSLISSKEFYF